MANAPPMKLPVPRARAKQHPPLQWKTCPACWRQANKLTMVFPSCKRVRSSPALKSKPHFQNLSKLNVPATPSNRVQYHMNKHLTIHTFNAKSIKNNVQEINHSISSHKIHVCAISETWLGPSVAESTITLPNFQPAFRRNCNMNGVESISPN